jgi:hypothetical protein
MPFFIVSMPPELTAQLNAVRTRQSRTLLQRWRTYFSATRVPPRRLEDSETTLVAVMGYMMQIVSSVQNTTAHGNIFTLANWVWLVGLLMDG